MERRDFIKHTAAIASVSAVGGIVEARPLQREMKLVVGVVLVDERFSDSKRFASVYEAHGARVISLEHDIGRIWYGGLREQCLLQGTVVAGLTLHSDLFVSQQFARECKKTWIQFGTHDCRGRQTLAHSIPANTGLDLRSSDVWAAEVASCMLDSYDVDVQTVTQSTTTVRSSDHPGSLYSWMIV